MPIKQLFFPDCSEVMPDLPEKKEQWAGFVDKLDAHPQNHRSDAVRATIGRAALEQLKYAKIFMIGCGAIGCELLKNYAMISLGTGRAKEELNNNNSSTALMKENGVITITDPDHIETSNLNRQFLFREKHLRKPKSATAAAVVQQMNPEL